MPQFQKLKKSTKLLLIVFFFVSLFFVLNFTSASAEDSSILVKFNQPKDLQTVKQGYSLKSDQVKEIPHLNTYRIKNASWWQKSKLYFGKYLTKKIDYIEPDYQIKLMLTPNDPRYSEQWALPKISAASAWDKTTGSNTVKLAIIDSGINGLHEDLSGKVTAGHAYTDSGATDYAISANTDSDDQGHGTAVSSAAAAIGNNSKGIAGLNWQAQLMPVKVFKDYWWGYGAYSSDVALGITYAADNGAKVLNMSLGSAYPSNTIENAVNYAYNTKGVVLAAASGNENTSVSYPARYANVIAVGATNQSDSRCSPSDWGYGYGSNYGAELDVTAPGNSVLSAEDSASGNSYVSVSGTSIASPYVSGLAALILANEPGLTNAQVRDRIEDNADKVSGMGGSDFSVYYGYGRINSDASVPSLNTYHYTWQSQNAYPTLLPGESYTFSLTVNNTGTATWTQDVVHLATDRPRDRVPFYTLGAGWTGSNQNRIQMQESSVASGSQATYNFTMTIPQGTAPGTYREYFRLVADGVSWMEDYGIYWDITIERPHFQYVSQTPSSSGDPDAAYITVSPGQNVDLTLTVRNSGSATWSKTGSTPVRLGTSNPRDRVSDFGRGPGWLAGSTNRVELTDSTVTAGSTTTFYFRMIAPSSPGTYREYFQPVAESLTWMEDCGIYWNIKVQ